MSISASNKKLALENKRLRKVVTDLTKAYVEVIDLCLKCSMENIGLKPTKK